MLRIRLRSIPYCRCLTQTAIGCGGYSLLGKNYPGSVNNIWVSSWGHEITAWVNILDGQWHHVASTFSSGSYKIYVDGILQGSGFMPTNTVLWGNGATGAYIGAYRGYDYYDGQNYHYKDGVDQFRGQIDEVAIYNRALTAEEIQQEYQHGLAGEGTVFSQSCTAGVGACQNTGTQTRTCGISGWSDWGTCSATAGTPGTETCDGIDNNCDGTVDNGLTAPSQSCTVGVGACQNTGTQVKTCNGVSGWSDWGTCSAIAGSPTAETCNNVDDDCDGAIDEVYACKWNGFFQPVDNLPTLNQVKAGSAIPVKFSLGGSMGLNIFEAGYPKSGAITCSSTATVDAIETTVTAGGSSLNYDPIADQYNYVWKTDKSWTFCRQLIVKLSDGTIHYANFKFK